VHACTLATLDPLEASPESAPHSQAAPGSSPPAPAPVPGSWAAPAACLGAILLPPRAPRAHRGHGALPLSLPAPLPLPWPWAVAARWQWHQYWDRCRLLRLLPVPGQGRGGARGAPGVEQGREEGSPKEPPGRKGYTRRRCSPSAQKPRRGTRQGCARRARRPTSVSHSLWPCTVAQCDSDAVRQ